MLRADLISRRGRRVAATGASLAALVALTACCGSSDGNDKQPAAATPAAQQQTGAPGAVAGDEGDADEFDDMERPERPIADYRHVQADPSDATPDLLCGVKLDVPNDGPQVRKRARDLRVPMHIVFYDVDHHRDGRFDELDKRRFARWMDINVPPDSHQFITIDYEKPYWKELRNYRDLPPERLKEIIAVYREILDFAKARRPKARWGFYGLPMKQYAMKDGWKQRIKELGEMLLKHQDVVYLAIYDNRIGDRHGLDLTAIRTYVELSLAAAGDRPVYAYARGRYMGRPQKFQWIPDDEFRANLEAALDARWHDGKQERRLTGIIFWDGLKDRRPNPATPEQLDALYARQLKIVQDTVRARRGGKVLSPPPRTPNSK